MIVGRGELGLRAPRRPPVAIATPAESWLHHTGGPGSNRAAVRAVQDWHMDGEGWSDIAYPFLVGNGEVREGRGALVDHLTAHGSTSFVICLMGEHHRYPVADHDLDAAGWLLAHALLSGWTTSEILGGHRDIPDATPSACPGDHGIAAITPINRIAARIITDLANRRPPPMIIAVHPSGHRELSNGIMRRPFINWDEFVRYRDAGVPVVDLTADQFHALQSAGRR